jgi:protein-disulfide isomerase
MSKITFYTQTLSNSVLLIALILLSSSAILAQQAKAGAFPAWIKGNPKAKVAIEVFNDYECPACATFQKTLEEIEQKYGDKVQLIYRNFPLKTIHPKAMAAAQAAEAAGKQHKFWEMIKLLYEKQNKWKASEKPEKRFLPNTLNGLSSMLQNSKKILTTNSLLNELSQT